MQRADGMLNKVYLTEPRLNCAAIRPRLRSRFVSTQRYPYLRYVSESGVSRLATTSVHNCIASIAIDAYTRELLNIFVQYN